MFMHGIVRSCQNGKNRYIKVLAVPQPLYNIATMACIYIAIYKDFYIPYCIHAYFYNLCMYACTYLHVASYGHIVIYVRI